MIPTILAWTLPTFLFKDLTRYISTVDMLILNHFIWHVFLFSFAMFILLFYKRGAIEFAKSIKTIPRKYIYFQIFMVILGIISQLLYFKLLKKVDVIQLKPTIRTASTILTILIGYYIYNEHLSLLKLIGLVAIIIGMFLINTY